MHFGVKECSFLVLKSPLTTCKDSKSIDSRDLNFFTIHIFSFITSQSVSLPNWCAYHPPKSSSHGWWSSPSPLSCWLNVESHVFVVKSQLVGGDWNMAGWNDFPFHIWDVILPHFCWEEIFPNWRTHIFFRGVGWNHQPVREKSKSGRKYVASNLQNLSPHRGYLSQLADGTRQNCSAEAASVLDYPHSNPQMEKWIFMIFMGIYFSIFLGMTTICIHMDVFLVSGLTYVLFSILY